MHTRFKTETDFRKSLETRLKTISEKTARDLQRLRRQVAFDRLLARLFADRWSPFVLKGGYAMELRLSTTRATKDIDLTWTRKLPKAEGFVKDGILEELRALARQELGDYFVYQIEEARLDLENAPYGGARYPVSSFLGDKLFVRFHLDVGADIVVDKTEQIQTMHWLDFCDVPAPVVSVISIEQQFAEKLHAYTLSRGDRMNTRTKDLVDMLLLSRMKSFDVETLVDALRRVFQIREVHTLPHALEPPPREWARQYAAMAQQCGLTSNMDEAFEEIKRWYRRVVSQ